LSRRFFTSFLQLFGNCLVKRLYNAKMKPALCTLAAGLLLAWLPAVAGEKWTVHEWGTFTSLQDESGNAIGGINTDDEPVPAFVHRLNYRTVLTPTEAPNIFFKCVPMCHPEITMRMETPVIYFHPPKSDAGVQTVDVSVLFHGGWLSEFYPDADLAVPGLETNGAFQFGHLYADTDSRLTWKDLKVGGDWPVTDTSARVWTSPRAVESASVQTAGGESEKFLFYRGVAHIDAPLRVSRDTASGELLFRSQLENLPASDPLSIQSMWLVDIQPGGNIAFRVLPPLSLTHDSKTVLTQTRADFAPGDYNPGNLDKLKVALQSALESQGLYPDEALALLNTWEVSYFKSTGLRVFFLVPRAWTDSYLPLQISQPADISRVMVGRVELVTSRQRGLLRQISAFSTNQIQQDALQLATNFFGRLTSAYSKHLDPLKMEQARREMDAVTAGLKPLSEFGPIPKTYQTYLDLGRFRNALILDQAAAHPTAGLTNFIATYRLQGYRPVDTPAGGLASGHTVSFVP
jgi:hypothetical protein